MATSKVHAAYLVKAVNLVGGPHLPSGVPDNTTATCDGPRGGARTGRRARATHGFARAEASRRPGSTSPAPQKHFDRDVLLAALPEHGYRERFARAVAGAGGPGRAAGDIRRRLCPLRGRGRALFDVTCSAGADKAEHPGLTTAGKDLPTTLLPAAARLAPDRERAYDLLLRVASAAQGIRLPAAGAVRRLRAGAGRHRPTARRPRPGHRRRDRRTVCTPELTGARPSPGPGAGRVGARGQHAGQEPLGALAGLPSGTDGPAELSAGAGVRITRAASSTATAVMPADAAMAVS